MIILKLLVLVIYTNIIMSLIHPVTTSNFEFKIYFCASKVKIKEVLKCVFSKIHFPKNADI